LTTEQLKVSCGSGVVRVTTGDGGIDLSLVDQVRVGCARTGE